MIVVAGHESNCCFLQLALIKRVSCETTVPTEAQQRAPSGWYVLPFIAHIDGSLVVLGFSAISAVMAG